MSNIILMHNDLDGLYSGLLFYLTNKDNIKFDEVRGIDYGKDHSTLYDQFDNFFVFDFAENPGEDKTLLWVDHHLHQDSSDAQFQVFAESPSCARLMIDKEIVEPDLISEEDLLCIDSVDSAKFEWTKEFTPEDMLFPTLNGARVGKFLILNQLLRKNRKTGMLEKLFATESLDIDLLLYQIENDRGPKVVKYEEYIENKQKLLEKLITDSDNYINYLSSIPVLFTKKFSQKDWKGYDLNMLGYLANQSPYIIVVFDFSSGINIQIARNMLFKGKVHSLYQIIKEEVDDPRGHEGIINMSFDTRNDAIDKINKIVTLLESYV